jgi:hypothetical protein
MNARERRRAAGNDARRELRIRWLRIATSNASARDLLLVPAAVGEGHLAVSPVLRSKPEELSRAGRMQRGYKRDLGLSEGATGRRPITSPMMAVQ